MLSAAPATPLTHWPLEYVAIFVKNIIFKLIILNCSTRHEITFRWMPQNLTYEKCHQARSHYLNQCWPRSMSPYGITRPQWVKEAIFSWNIKPCPHTWAVMVCCKSTLLILTSLLSYLITPAYFSNFNITTLQLPYVKIIWTLTKDIYHIYKYFAS